MIRKLLIANRGEIARRIIRATKKLNIRSVAVYSKADEASLHVVEADEAYLIGEAAPKDSYLNLENVLRAIKDSGADAVHPGYGFLSENEAFVAAVQAQGVIFVGPKPASMKRLGEKGEARELAKSLNIPVAKGRVLVFDSKEAQSKEEVLRAQTSDLKFPLLLKAALGGGGRGMRLVTSPEQLTTAVSSAAREAKQFFASDSLLVEEFITPARHVEVQLLGDRFGNILHFFERDCSAQRKSQKTIEESPARDLSGEFLEKLYAASLSLGKAGELQGLATAEFLIRLDSSGKATGEFYFLEVNPRIQVEHPVTEMITGVDLVEEQLRVASGEKVTFQQADIKRTGHAIQARVYAEIPELGFLPSEGVIRGLSLPKEVPCKLRLEHALLRGGAVETTYDPMLGKIISWGETFEQSRSELLSALNRSEVEGVSNNLRFLERTLESAEFRSGTLTTETLESWSQDSISAEEGKAAFIAYLAEESLRAFERFGDNAFFRPLQSGFTLPLRTWDVSSSHTQEVFRFRSRLTRFHFELNSLSLEIQLDDEVLPIRCQKQAGNWNFAFSGKSYPLLLREKPNEENHAAFTFLHQEWKLQPVLKKQEHEASNTTSEMFSPFPGTILKVLFPEGSSVQAGETVFIIESMKMEHQLPAPKAGLFSECQVSPGSKVSAGSKLCKLL